MSDGRGTGTDWCWGMGAALIVSLVIDIPAMIWGGFPLWAALTVLGSALAGGAITCL